MFLAEFFDPSTLPGVPLLSEPAMAPSSTLVSISSSQRDVRRREAVHAVSTAPSCHPLQDASLPLGPNTRPVVIPPKRTLRGCPGDPFEAKRRTSPTRRVSSVNCRGRSVPAPVATLLQSTAIPPRRSGSLRRTRQLSPGDFNRVLFDDIQRRDDGPPLDGPHHSPLDLLLTPPDDENEKSMFSCELESEGQSSSLRSTSADSMPSLDHESHSVPTSEPTTPSPPVPRRVPEKRKQLSSPESCPKDHPLLDVEIGEMEELVTLQTPASEHAHSASREVSRSRTLPRLRSSFKSNLTASLRAIKSAAQTVSNFTTPSVQPEDFFARSVFSIAPALTDDRRPRPMNEPPSAALRRYLNPITLSPAEMHMYHEHPTDSLRGTSISIQLQTYTREGTPKHKCADPVFPPPRQREPRENSDFLRMVVLEMNMRRDGKLRNDVPPRAKVWLPPRSQPHYVATDDSNKTSSIPRRWVGISVECS